MVFHPLLGSARFLRKGWSSLQCIPVAFRKLTHPPHMTEPQGPEEVVQMGKTGMLQGPESPEAQTVDLVGMREEHC